LDAKDIARVRARGPHACHNSAGFAFGPRADSSDEAGEVDRLDQSDSYEEKAELPAFACHFVFFDVQVGVTEKSEEYGLNCKRNRKYFPLAICVTQCTRAKLRERV
jgi:hypothetical protein